MAWTAYDTGSSGFNVAAAISEQFKKAYGSEVRLLPSGNDTGRLSPVKAGRAVISQMGIGTYFAQEGVFEFGAKIWGPQPVRLIVSATACNGLGLAVARDTGVKEIKDLKGKRVATLVGSPALTQGMLALIAFADQTEKDVTLVPFPSNNAMWKGIINNEADVALSSTISGQSKEADDSPRGILWLPLPLDDKAGWARVHKKAPYFVPMKAMRLGRALAWQSGGDVRLRLSDLHDLRRPAGRHDPRHHQGHDRYLRRLQEWLPRGGRHGAAAAELPMGHPPYHDGAIRAFKDKGVWTEAANKHNDGLVKRQQVMMDAWKTFRLHSPPDEKAATEAWLKARAAALHKAGMDPVFE